jgi:hypothetical protein
MSTVNVHPYFVRAEQVYQTVVKPAFLKAKAKFVQTGNEDDLLPFGMPERPLPNDTDSKDKGTGHNGSRQSPTVFITSDAAAADLPDGKANVVVGELYLRSAAELISRRTHRLSTVAEVKQWREAGAARQEEAERQERERVSRKNRVAIEAQQIIDAERVKNDEIERTNKLLRERIELEERAAKLAKGQVK